MRVLAVVNNIQTFKVQGVLVFLREGVRRRVCGGVWITQVMGLCYGVYVNSVRRKAGVHIGPTLQVW